VTKHPKHNEAKVVLHTITKQNGDEVLFYTDFDYSDYEVLEGILKQGMSGDCGEFLAGSARWAMDMWTKGNKTGYMWALKVACDIRANLKSRITLRNLYQFFRETTTTCTEVLVKDNLVLRLSWDRNREWIWVKRLYPIRYADKDRTYDSVTTGAIWEDGVYRQLSKNALTEDEVKALKSLNMKPKQQWADKRGWVRYDELFDNDDQEDKERMSFPSQEEAERWERNRRVEQYLANQQVNDLSHSRLTVDQQDTLDDLNAEHEADIREAEAEARR